MTDAVTAVRGKPDDGCDGGRAPSGRGAAVATDASRVTSVAARGGSPGWTAEWQPRRSQAADDHTTARQRAVLPAQSTAPC